MDFDSLTAISPIDGRYNDKTAALRPYFSEFALMKYRLTAKIHWLIALSNEKAIKELPPLSADDKTYLLSLIDNFSTTDAKKIKSTEAKTHHDLKAVEYYLREQCQSHKSLSHLSQFIHFACTSDDVNNIAYALMIKNAREDILLPAMQTIVDKLSKLADEHANLPMLAHTHGQAATPTTLGKEYRVFAERLKSSLHRFKETPIKAKCNGATGNFNAHVVAYPEIDWITLSKNYLENFSLTPNLYTTQIEPHDYIAHLSHTMNQFNTVLVDVSRDMWLYISKNYFSQKVDEHSVGSSTMPHKINPIDFENAEGNLGISNALLNHFADKLPISRLQRDLSDSTVLRNIGVALSHSLIAYQSLQKGIEKLHVNQDTIAEDLNNHWSVLTEAVQTVMRRYGHDDAYEQLKTLSRGKAINKAILHDFIQQTDLPDDAKQRLLALTPETYIGLAVELSKH
ncbi:MAG: adenylosuccinate lyase [Legionellaceae bacterium]|nr:adenylosuccinate lyase [Legionellaceae bacterium]